MKRIIFILSLCFIFVSCSNSVSIPSEENVNNETRSSEETSYPKLKVENKKTTGDFIFLIELPNYKISPLEIRGGESMTFELTNGLWCYENVTVMLQYGPGRNYQNYVYVRKNFKDGETTVVTLQ